MGSPGSLGAASCQRRPLLLMRLGLICFALRSALYLLYIASPGDFARPASVLELCSNVRLEKIYIFIYRSHDKTKVIFERIHKRRKRGNRLLKY